jgi:hypothetical protein
MQWVPLPPLAPLPNLIITTCHHTHHHRFLCKEPRLFTYPVQYRPFVALVCGLWDSNFLTGIESGTMAPKKKAHHTHSMGNQKNPLQTSVSNKAHQVRYAPELDTCLGSSLAVGPLFGEMPPS